MMVSDRIKKLCVLNIGLYLKEMGSVLCEMDESFLCQIQMGLLMARRRDHHYSPTALYVDS